MTDLKETLYNIAKAIVDSPDEVVVSETVDGKKGQFDLDRCRGRYGYGYWQARKDSEGYPYRYESRCHRRRQGRQR